MIHLTDTDGAWLTLIEIGALLQIVAICAYVRETYGSRRPMRSGEEEEGIYVQEQGLECRMPDEAKTPQARPTRSKRLDEDARGEVKADHLENASQAKFVQKLNFRRHGT